MSWIVIARSCESCGNNIAFEIFPHEPIYTDVQSVKDSLGGMWCIRQWVKKIEDGINEIENEDYF